MMKAHGAGRMGGYPDYLIFPPALLPSVTYARSVACSVLQGSGDDGPFARFAVPYNLTPSRMSGIQARAREKDSDAFKHNN